MTTLNVKEVIATTRWIVEIYNGCFWDTWRHPSSINYRFHCLENAKKQYHEYRREFHFCTAPLEPFRFCEIVIQPEKILSHRIIETDMNGFDENYIKDEE